MQIEERLRDAFSRESSNFHVGEVTASDRGDGVATFVLGDGRRVKRRFAVSSGKIILAPIGGLTAMSVFSTTRPARAAPQTRHLALNSDETAPSLRAVDYAEQISRIDPPAGACMLAALMERTLGRTPAPVPRVTAAPSVAQTDADAGFMPCPRELWPIDDVASRYSGPLPASASPFLRPDPRRPYPLGGVAPMDQVVALAVRRGDDRDPRNFHPTPPEPNWSAVAAKGLTK